MNNLEKFFNMKPKPQDKMEIENPQKTASLPWVQKYRPNNLDELTYQQEVTTSLKTVLKDGNMPNLLFYGPAGTGKTSAIIALCKQLFGPSFYKQRVLQLNASDQRGIAVIRDKVKRFAQQVSVQPQNRNYKCPSYKVIILDEADLMTTEAQSALRRVMEDNSQTTRFCIICNYITKIIQPVISRCVKFRFKSIPLQAQMQKLRHICNEEKVQLDEEQIQILLEKGDLRQSINSLQSFQKLSFIPAEVLPISQHFGQDILRRILDCRDIHEVIEVAQELGYQGYASDEILNTLSQSVLGKNIDERKKAMMMEIAGRAQESLTLGATQMPIVEVLTSMYYVFNLQI